MLIYLKNKTKHDDDYKKCMAIIFKTQVSTHVALKLNALGFNATRHYRIKLFHL